MGDYKEALRNYDKIIEKDDEFYYRKRAIALHKIGKTQEALELMNNHIENKMYRASIFAAMEDRDSMYATLNRVNSVYRVKDEVFLLEFDPYRDEPEFQKFQEENFIQFTF